MVLAFAYSLCLTLYKTDISLRRTLSAGPKGVRLGESYCTENNYNQLSPRRTPLGPVLRVRLRKISVL